MKGRAILVIDTNNGFLNSRYPLYCGDESRKIIPHIQKLIEREKCPVIFTSDAHEEYDPEFRLFGKHCVTGTTESDIVHELSNYKDSIVFDKEYYSPWTNPDFTRFMLEQIGINTTLYFTGVCTDICVFHTVAGAYFSGFEKLIIPESCVASFNNENHKIALEWMKNQFGALIINSVI